MRALVERWRGDRCRVAGTNVRDAADQVEIHRSHLAGELLPEQAEIDATHLGDRPVGAVGQASALSLARYADPPEHLDLAGRRRGYLGPEHDEASIDHDRRLGVDECGQDVVAGKTVLRTTVEPLAPRWRQNGFLVATSGNPRQNLVRGGIYGPELTPTQLGPGRFANATCGIDGLFLAGAGTKGGSVRYCVTSGIQAGEKALAALP